MILYTQDEVEKYTRMLARTYDVVSDLSHDMAGDARACEQLLKDIERVMGWNVPPPKKAKPPEPPKVWHEQFKKQRL